ncbi:MAG: hemophore-related protein [Mycobacteriaceae bacterium]|nr:hemophore-related protein [Mycobacteriaceae bacterium]
MIQMTTRIRGLSYAATAAGLACLAVAVAGPAQADDLNSTTCSEPQIMSALQQDDPVVWSNISSDPKLEQQLRVGLAVLLAAPPGQRQQQVNTLENILGYQRWAGVSSDIMDTTNGPIGRAVNNCHNF